MSEKTNIEWASSTGSPWIGCSKVSPGCKNCYAAELDAQRFSKTMGGGTKENPESHWGKGAPRVRTKAFWTDAVKWDRQIHRTCRACGHQWSAGDGYCPRCKMNECDWVRPRIFPSLCDWLDDEVPIEWLADFLKLIHDTPNLDWLLLTKRPENWRARICAVWRHLITTDKTIGWAWLSAWESGTGPANVWVGVSVEDQKRADGRVPLLVQIPAKVRFLSVEPLLGQVDLNRINIDGEMCDECRKPITNSCLSQTAHCDCCVEGDEPVIFGPINWIIVGGESGKDRRDCGVEALCDVARQGVAAGVPCFVKQDSAFKPGQQGRIPNDIWAMKQFPTV